MCGIAGEVRWSGDASSSVVARMVACLRHRGPDDDGVWRSPDGACALGHARLSILDLSPAGHQPMIDNAGASTVVFNGEIYNFAELRRMCERKGYVFRSQSDTEVILALYGFYRHDCVHHLRGMFAFALYDSRRRELFLARDRVGKKPLNYALSPRGVVFASELTSLAQHPQISSAHDVEALQLYLQLQYVPAPWTIYRDIRKLPAASFAVISESGMSVHEYWNVDYRQKRSIAESDALDGLDSVIRDAVRLRLVADVPVGALLSGGVDSSLVVAMMAQESDTPPKTFSVGFFEEAFSELPYAQTVADQYRTEHFPTVISSEVELVLFDIARHYGEPFADSSAVPSFQVSRVAREHVKVVMNGDGGDELLGGYPRYALSSRSIAVGTLLAGIGSSRSLVRAAASLSSARSIPTRIARKLLMRYVHPDLQSLTMYADFWDDDARHSLLGHPSATLEAWRMSWYERARAYSDNPIDRMLWIDNRTYLTGDLLVKMDIASMHCGLETRSPLLDHKVIEFCASLPVSMKVRSGVGKYLLKKLAERYLPHDLLYRRKMGFSIPLAQWLRGPLAPLVSDVILRPGALPLLNERAVSELVREFNAGAAHASRVWSLLMYGLWYRQSRSSG